MCVCYSEMQLSVGIRLIGTISWLQTVHFCVPPDHHKQLKAALQSDNMMWHLNPNSIGTIIHQSLLKMKSNRCTSVCVWHVIREDRPTICTEKIPFSPKPLIYPLLVTSRGNLNLPRGFSPLIYPQTEAERSCCEAEKTTRVQRSSHVPHFRD